MNLLLLSENELEKSRVTLSDSRALHIIKIIKPNKNDSLKAGIINGQTGHAVVRGIAEDAVELEFYAESEPPAPSDISLILALPRPKVFRRVLFSAVSCGVKDIHIINSWRVEKSYWDSPYISGDSVDKICLEALSQAKDTVLPRVRFHRFFMEFFEQGLNEIPGRRTKYLAHPGGKKTDIKAPAAVAVGPEGGFIEREVGTFEKNGFTAFSPAERVLTTEHFVPFVLGKLSN